MSFTGEEGMDLDLGKKIEELARLNGFRIEWTCFQGIMRVDNKPSQELLQCMSVIQSTHPDIELTATFIYRKEEWAVHIDVCEEEERRGAVLSLPEDTAEENQT